MDPIFLKFFGQHIVFSLTNSILHKKIFKIKYEIEHICLFAKTYSNVNQVKLGRKIECYICGSQSSISVA